jgi:tetratricopeptide (TPR) repeat protein
MITDFGTAAFRATAMACILAIGATSAWAAPPTPPAVQTQPAQGVGIGIVIGIPQPGIAIGGGGLPMQMYYNHVGTVYAGDYKSALDGYKADLGLGRMTTNSRWIDSICYYTMIGECYYREGRFAEALENYNAALQLQLAFPNWMARVQFPALLQANAGGVTTPWGRSNRTAKVWIPPQNMSVAEGQLFLNLQPNSSQVVVPPQYLQVGVAEIVRCTVLALKRRQEIMGPVCPNDRFTEQLFDAFSHRPGQQNHWSEGWVDAELGMAYLGMGQAGQAVAYLKRAVTLGGEYDHPLTPLLLEELGQLSIGSGDYEAASKYLEEASYSAYAFKDLTVMEESFRYGQQAHLLSGAHGNFPPLEAAIRWSKPQSYALELRASLCLSLAEGYALQGQHPQAIRALEEAKSVGRHDMFQHQIGARLDYLNALVGYQQGNVPLGDGAILNALALERAGSLWLFQIALADDYIQRQLGPHLGPHGAVALYDLLLRDPAPIDWASRPLETLAVMATPHSKVYEHWFETTLQSGIEASLEVADRARRHHFFSTLPLGGRLLALRWVLEAPDGALDPQVLLQRQNILTHYAQYTLYSKQVKKLRGELSGEPLVADSPKAARIQADKLAEIARISQLQETLLREIALRREAAELVFPPLRKTHDVQAALPPRSALLIFFTTSRSTYAFLMSKGHYMKWTLESPPALEKKLSALLRTIGNFDANHEIAESQLADDTWRQAARDLTDALLAGSNSNGNFLDGIDELVVVPDGPLWYLPFEALQVPAHPKDLDRKDTVPLISRTRVRYLPTMGLAIPDLRDRLEAGETGVVLGKMFPRDEPQAVQTEFDRLKKILPHADAIKSPLPAASPLYASLFDGIVVFDEVNASINSDKGHYEWNPIPLDRAKNSGTLSQWFALPWKSPTTFILPGFRTPAESALKQAGPGAGNEMFLSICGLMSTGSRTILISRWRTGGESSYELVRQFVQELPYASAADAWQRSVEMLFQTPLDLNREPRVKRLPGGDSVTGRNPFFWAGYLLADTGWSPPKAEQAAAPIIVRPQAQPPQPPAALPDPKPAPKPDKF